MGTRITNLQVTKVTDGDTVKVMLDGKEESLRLICVDTEESWPGGSKPVTQAGLLASEMAKGYFGDGAGGFVTVDIEFDTNDPVDVCLAKHRGNYGRLLCYIHKGEENYNLKLVAEGWSPYFDKYGRSRAYHDEMVRAEAQAQAASRVIWDAAIQNRGDYKALKSWWSTRAGVVEDFRRYGLDSGTLSVRMDYEVIMQAAQNKRQITVLCDFQSGIQKWAGGGALIYAGSIYHKFDLWIPDAQTEEAVQVINLIEKRYAGTGGLGYAYVTGEAKLYRDKPEIVLTSAAQISDFPPGR